MSVRGLGYDPQIEADRPGTMCAEICEINNWLMLITARSNSPHSMEGAKTIAYEICQQLNGEVPDVVYVPVGGGGLISSHLERFQASGALPVTSKGFRAWSPFNRRAAIP